MKKKTKNFSYNVPAIKKTNPKMKTILVEYPAVFTFQISDADFRLIKKSKSDKGRRIATGLLWVAIEQLCKSGCLVGALHYHGVYDFVVEAFNKPGKDQSIYDADQYWVVGS